MIEVSHLTKRFGYTTAVKDVSFSVKNGEVVGFLGPNGAGKTTTMRILTCYLPADEGKATLAGHDIFRESLAVRQQVGYLPESAPLYTDMEVDAFLDYIGRLRKIPSRELSKRKEHAIDSCGLGSVRRKLIGILSKGYRQRVGLAQCLIHDPQILILDEPTSGLDPNQIIEIRTLIREIGKEKTIILSTHILQEVQAVCGRVLIINRGQIVADGTAEELMVRSRHGNRLVIGTRGEIEPIEAALRQLPGAGLVRRLASSGAVRRLTLDTTRDGTEIAEEVFQMAVDRGWVLTELHVERASLEDIFKEMTEGAA